MKWICFIAFLCAGAPLSVAQITFLDPMEGEAFNDKDPATDCITGILTFDGISTAGTTISYSILTVDPSGAGNVFSVNSMQKLVCDPDLVQSTTYTITAQAEDTRDQNTVTFTVSFVATDPLVITLPASTLTLVKDLFEAVAAADRATAVNFEFTVSKDGASVTVLPVSPATEVPFEATLKTGTTNTFVLDLTQSLNTSDETFSIDIKASTTGPPAEEATERVTVTLENRPQFTSPFDEVYTKDIDENIDSSTPIVELSASDADNDALTFSIASTTPPSNTPLFRIDGTELKREADIGNAFNIDEAGEDLTFNLTIRVSDGTYQSETIVIINIQDVNDVIPTFSDGQTFVASVLETTPAGEEIFKATASDLDFSAPNNEIMFSLTGTDNNHFLINDEGSVTVASPSQLDYTSKPVYELEIVVEDKGTPSLSASVSFNVTVETAPKFIVPADSNFPISVPEDTVPGTSIFQFDGEDEDNGPMNLEYTLEDVEPASGVTFFYVDGDSLKTNTTFDLEGSVANYTLTVSVSDGTYQSETTVIINIQDVNDVAPTFSPGQTFVASVLETTPAGEEIFKATASDLDFSAPNNEIMFSLTGTDNDHFMINDEGSVTVASPSQLDYTSKQQYELEIVVEDKGTPSLSASVSFNVTLETAPKFTTPSDSTSAISVLENTTSGSSIFKFVGDDEDSEPGDLVYTLESAIPASGLSSFFLNGDTLETNTVFDIDGSGNSVADYTLTVRVSDTKYMATTMLSVNITDVNDERPVFNETSYSVNIPESQNTGEEILKVSATDSDATSPNNEFSYSLSGTSSDHFSIDADTGSISVASPSMLDYTDIPVYNIQVAATDKGATFQFTTAVTLTITIETAPKFTTPSDSNSAKSVAEDTASGSSIFQFVGEDEDSEPEDLEYTLEGVDPVSGLTFFYVDGDTLKTNTTFDLESSGGSVADYSLTVSVTDGKYTATTLLSVNITDVNDETPTFDEVSYALDVLESQTAGEVILNVSATDNDLTSPGNEFSFSLTGIANNHFSIDADTGSISVTPPSMLNFTNIEVYNLQVVVTDKGSTNQLSSSVPLTLTIKTAPVFIEPSDTSTVVTTSETTGPNSPLLVTEVMDKDQDPTSLTFSVTNVQPASGTSFFTMDGVTLKTSAGITTSTFDLEPSGSTPVQSYVVDIRVFDGTYSADTTIRVNITDVNDHTPEFSGPITQTINDVLEIDQEVTVVTATDDDYSDEYNTVTYSLAGLDGSQDYTTFQIGSSTGSITLASELKKRVYTFLVKATDKDAREANATVTVSVTDTVDECSDSSCQNAATCYNNINYFYCDCVDGWAGTICNTNINDCDPNPCENNGECIDGVASYSCNCSSGWTGTNCTEACTNNRYGRNCAETCQCNETRLAADVGVQKCNITTGYCFCNAMWTGADCTIDADECAENTSLCIDLPNEVCENTPGSYECVCRQGFVKNATQVCVQDVAENTTVSTNTSQTVVRTTFTQNLENCPDLTKPSEYDRMQHQIEAVESNRIPSAISLQAFGLRCGSITYELAIVINDTDAARLSLANDLSEVSNGKPLVLENQSTVTTAMNVSGNPVATNRTVDASVLLCNIFTSYSPCGSSYECRISAGIPRCVKRDDDDNTELILGLSLGIPLAVLALACLVLVICFCQRIMRDKERDSGNRPERSRRDNYDDRRRDTPSKSSVPAYEESDQRVPYMPYTPSVEYNYRSSMPILSGTNKGNPGIPHKDWIFYSPAKNGAGNYRYSQRY